MQDTMLGRGMRLTIMGLIAVLALGALVFGYQALFAVVGPGPISAAEPAVWATLAGLSAWGLIRFRDDLVDA